MVIFMELSYRAMTVHRYPSIATGKDQTPRYREVRGK